MFYTEIAPPPALSRWVHSFWTFTAPDDLEAPYPHRVLPDGCLHLVWLPRADFPDGGLLMASGPRMEALEVPVQAGDRFFGVRLRPGTARPLLEPGAPHPLPDLHALHAPLPVLAPEASAALLPRLTASDGTAACLHACETALAGWVDRADAPDAAVEAAVAHLHDGQSRIADAADAAALSERQLQRRFRHAVGLTPKQFARVRRFRTALGNVLRASPETWGRVAVDCGFADQAHLTREFVAFFGAPPEALRAHIGPIAHGDVTP